MSSIHPSAVVDPAAELADDVSVGPFCVVGPDVVLAAGVKLDSHVTVEGSTRVGERTRIWPFAALGGAPQHARYAGDGTRLEVGADCLIREHVTLHRGTEGDRGLTRVGDRCMLMVGSHVAHDCVLADDVVLANNVQLGGHVELGPSVFVGGNAGLHQRVRVGEGGFVAGGAVLLRDLVPHAIASGNPALLVGPNLVGLRRAGVDRGSIAQVRALRRWLFFEQEGTLAARIEEAAGRWGADPLAEAILRFAGTTGPRGLVASRLD